MINHKFKLDRISMVLYKGKMIEIEVWKCIYCNKLQIIDKDNCKVISLDGRMGEEIEL